MKSNTLAIVAIAATIAALLIATNATSILTNEALAKKTSFHRIAAQSCVNVTIDVRTSLDKHKVMTMP